MLKLCSRRDKEPRPSPAVGSRSGLSLPGLQRAIRAGLWLTSIWMGGGGRRGGGGRGHRNEGLDSVRKTPLMTGNDGGMVTVVVMETKQPRGKT